MYSVKINYVDTKAEALRVFDWKERQSQMKTTILNMASRNTSRKESTYYGNAENFIDQLDWISKSTPEEQKPFMPETAKDIYEEGMSFYYND